MNSPIKAVLTFTKNGLELPCIPLDISFHAETLHAMNSPIKAVLTFTKNGLELPCIPLGDAKVGSCTYDNVCDILAKLPEDCKSTGDIIGTIIADAGLPCRCPFSKNPNVAVTDAHIDLPKVPAFLAFLAEGVIDIKAEAYD